MDFRPTTEQQALRDSVRRFVAERYGFDAYRAIAARTPAFDPAIWRALAQNGWLAAMLPEKLGGVGASAIELAILAEELGRGLLLEPFLPSGVMAARALLSHIHEAGTQHLLQSLGSGEKIIVLAHGETGSAWAPEAVSTRAIATPDGGYAISGHKSVVLGAPNADTFLVSARTAGSALSPHGIALFAIDAASPGLWMQSGKLVDGRAFADLTLTNVAVRREQVIGRPGEALIPLGDALAHGIVALGAESVGIMDRALLMTRDYLRTRRQFGAPLASFQALQHALADVLVDVEMCRSMLHFALKALGSEDGAGALAELSAAKSYICTAAKRATAKCLQLHGGIGMTEEYAIGHLYRRAVANETLLGSAREYQARYMDLIRHRIGAQSKPGVAGAQPGKHS